MLLSQNQAIVHGQVDLHEKCAKFDVCVNVSYQTLFSTPTLIEELDARLGHA